jgi:elongation factor G
MLLERLREVFKFEVNTQPPRIAYRETITANAEGHHRHKKQSGGAGQFGEVFLRVEPLPRGAGFEFVDAVKGGTIPGQFIPAVEKGVREVLVTGAVAGYPVVDVRVTVHDGKHHSVDSKEIAFVTAGRKAFLQALREARPSVLEPIVHIEITAPEQHWGDLTGDLSAKRGVVSGTSNSTSGWMVVRALVPMSELTGYQSRLNALTSGQGRYSVALSHYEAVAPATQRQLMGQYAVKDED